jgi:nucleotide-binding universal stress UspA family protein
MYEKIVVPLDGSELAEVALPYAQELAAKLDACLVLVNVRAPGEDPDNPQYRMYLKKTLSAVEEKMRKSRNIPEGRTTNVGSIIIDPSGIVRTHAAEEIVAYADREKVDLIVMATHGSAGVRLWTLGSTAEKVVRAAKCDVLLIRANIGVPENVSLHTIVVPLDGSKQSEMTLLNVEALAPVLGAGVILLHVIAQPGAYVNVEGMARVPYTDRELKEKKEGAGKYLERLAARLKEKGISVKTVVKEGEAGRGIIDAADELKADLVAMSTHGCSGDSRWEHGSIADKVMHGGNTPLLLVRACRA